MTTGNQKHDPKNILMALILILLGVSVVQSIYLVKLHRDVEQKAPFEKVANYGEPDPGADDGFLKRFNLEDRDPFAELQSMRRHMERMFDDSQNRFIVKVNIPGADASEIKVDLQDNALTVEARTKNVATDRNRDDFLRMERSFGSFQRSFPLPGPVDEGKMETKYEGGVLTIILPIVG